MSKLDKLLKERVADINKDSEKLEYVRKWIGNGYSGKVVVFATPDKSRHMVFTKDKVFLRDGEYPSCEVRYIGSEEDLMAVFSGETSAYTGVRTGRLVVWGNLNEATIFERIP
jgi:hypothetical protein